ncbi:hypothetical protein A4G20_01560 [Pasteurellaceae bacterium RH1A]|nr:hypothetical protein A4G20_01560 [Pasteurellaceae bacterium RH1A]
MSAVIKRAKQDYLKLLKIELALLVITSLILALVKGWVAISFVLGCLAGFVPYCVFVYWIFFRQKSAKNRSPMTAFYQGEGIKWVLTILLIIVVLKGYPQRDLGLFFSGYFLMLFTTSFLPLVAKLKA